jgi:hypothetical protein
MDMTLTEAKRAAHTLRTDLGHTISHSQALEIVAHQLGHRDWNTAHAALRDGAGTPVPVLRILDEHRAREFYLDYLGFTTEWEHRFEPGMPLYTRLRRDRLVVDLSEHHGDGTPGSVIWVPVPDVHALHRELSTKNYPYLRPAVDEDAPGGATLTVTDPFSNVIRFCRRTKR